MPAGMARQWTWMRVWRDDWRNDRLLGVRWPGGGDTRGWEEVVGVTQVGAEVAQVAGDEKGRGDRWDSEWRTGVRE
jgi:hypothetical protein